MNWINSRLFLIFSLSLVGQFIDCQQQTIFVHGIADTYRQSFAYYNFGLLHKPFYAFNFADATDDFYRVKRECTAFGQDDEIALLNYTYEQIRQLNPSARRIVYGVSRGASAAFNFVALQKAAKIDALILESPFAAFDDVLDSIVQKLRMIGVPGAQRCVGKIISYIFPNYDWHGVRPIDLVQEISKDLPILLICSHSDARVPVSSTHRLYQALVDAGCKKVFLLQLNQALHAKILMSHERDLYIYAVHAFYQRCGLEHNPKWAEKGQWLLAPQERA